MTLRTGPMARRIGLLALAVGLAVGTLGVVVHTPPARRAVLRYVVAEVQRRYGIRLGADRLDYNLARLTIGLSRIHVAAERPGAVPFFEADYVQASLPARALLGAIAIDEIGVTKGHVRILRDRNGTNLPESSGTASAEPAALDIARLSAPGLLIEASDALNDATLALPAIDVEVGRTSGRIALARPASLTKGTQRTVISSLDGGMAFDGRALRVSSLQIRLDEGSARLDGTLQLLVRDPALDLRAAGTADVERLARWGGEGERPRGAVTFDVHATGALATPAADVHITSPSLTWGSDADLRAPHIAVTSVSASARVTTTAADIEDLQLAIANGRVTGKVLVPFNDSAMRLTASWSDIDAALLATMAAGRLQLSPSGRLSGDFEAAGPAARLSEWSADLRLHSAEGVTRRGLIAVAGDTRFQLAHGQWQVAARHNVGGALPIGIAAAGQLDESAPANSTLSGRIDIADAAVPDLLRLLRVVGAADVPQQAVSRGTLAAGVRLGGHLSTPEINGEISARNLAGAQFRIAAIDATLTGQAVVPQLTFSLEAREATVADQRMSDIKAAGRLDRDVVRLESLTAAQADGAGHLSAAGSYDLPAKGYDAAFDLADWDVAATAGQALSGRATATLRGTGTVSDPHGTGSVRVEGASWSGSTLGDLSADIQLSGQLATVSARAPDYNATLSSRTHLEAPFDTTAEFLADGIDIARLSHLAGAAANSSVPAIEGRATFVAHAAGSIEQWRDATATADLPLLDARVGELSIRLGAPAHLAYDRQTLRVQSLEVDAGATRLSASGDLPLTSGSGTLLVTALGDVGEVARAVSATGIAHVPVTGSGPLALLARVTGTLERPAVVADLEAGPGSITIQDLSTVSAVTVRGHVGNGTLDLREAHAAYEGATLDATGSIPLSLLTSSQPSTLPGSLHATAAGITPAILHGVLNPTALEDISGNVDLALNVETPALDITRITGDLTLTRFDLQLSGLPVTQRVPTRIVARDGFARIESWNWAGEGATLGVFGQVRLADRQAAILANGDVDLRVLSPFVRAAGMATAGRLTPKLSITGPIDSPRIDGDVLLEDGELRLLDPRIVVNGLMARAVLTRTTATLTTLTGSMNGGSLTGGGTVEYQPDSGMAAQFTADVRDMALDFPVGLRSELDATLGLEVTQQPGDAAPAGTLSGTVTVLRGAYREPLAVVGGLLAALRARQTAATGGGEGSAIEDRATFLKQLALDVRLQSDDDLIVNNNYARVQLGADIDLIGSAAAPGVSGRAVLREDGRLFVGRNVYTVKSDVPSTIDFVSPTTIAPELNVYLTTRVAGEDIDITLRGPAEAPQVDMSSTSGLGQADITALLLTGRTLDQLSTADASFIGTQVIGNLSGEVLGFAGRAVGLDTLRLGGVDEGTTRLDATAVATEVDPTSRLTFGKSLGPAVDLTFSQSLRDASAQTWIVEYMPERRVAVRVVSDDTDLRSYGFRHDVSFGGADRTTGRSPGAAARAVLRVADVTLTGELAFQEDRLRALLKLRPGDRFDFARWQEDRDRLEDFYHQNAHLSVRVSASRMSTADQVTLSYVVDAGPRTAIAVTGIDTDRALLQRLMAAWAASIFDVFLVDEATQIVKGALVERGYLLPVVEARLVREADVTTLAIEVHPGSSAEAMIRIQSPDPEVTPFLNARVAERQLAAEVVRDPGTVERDLTSDLRAHGYLQARVSIGTPLFEGAAAIVPITVDPGAVFLIDSVVFDGRNGLPAEEVADATPAMVGMPYDPGVLDVARDRLLALYRRRGFASADINPRAIIRSGAPRVDVIFEIQEGAPQSVADVVVSGNSGVDADVIVRAMRLTIGAPLEPEELVRARTRVFDTGLFRRVDVTTETMDRAAADKSQPMRVRVQVEAWPALRLRYGFTAVEERSESSAETRGIVPALSADVTRRTLFGRAVSLAGAAEYQRRERVARGVLTAPTMMSLPIQSTLVIERSRREIAAARVTDKNSLSWEERTRVATHLSLSYAYTFERNHTFVTIHRPGEPIFDVRTPIARLTASVAWDSRDDPVDATRGLLLSSSTTYAPQSLGSAFRFSKYVGQAYVFESWRGVVFASAGRLGMAWGLGGQELVPSERFFAGGARTVRGVADDSLGEQDFFGPIGGRALLVLNHEVRFPIFKWIRGVGFVDAGNVFASPAEIRLGDLAGALGAGLRLATPFALLRADYGRAVWGPESVVRSGRWIVGIGHAF